MYTVKKFAGKVILKNGYYLNQLSSDIEWISSRYIARYLKSTYNMTTQQYYNLVVYGDMDFIPKCPFCNNYRKFWRLSSGYYRTCSDSECMSKAHSKANVNRWIELSKDPNEYNLFCKSLGMASSVETYLNIHYGRWMSMGDPNDTCVFYIATSKKGLFKFGISSNIDTRSYFMGYTNFKVIYTGTRTQVGDLEYWIKLELDMRSEYLKWNEVSKFRKAYLNSLSKIK